MSEERFTGKKPSENAPEHVWKQYRDKLQKNLQRYKSKYHADKLFRDSEIKRNRERITTQYKNDEQFRKKMNQTALDYYYEKIKPQRECQAARNQ
jgi:hypothetical protein